MHIAIDASRTTVARVTGTERYALELIRAIIRQNSEYDITLYFRDTPSPDLFPSADREMIPLKRAWTHLRFARELWRVRPDITFVPAHTLPFWFPGKAIVTIHDLGYKRFPQAHPVKQRLYLDLTTRYSANRADIILADSQATADDLTRFYGTSQEKIHVVYPGVDKPTINTNDIWKQYRLPEHYFLFVGTLQPRKNIARIVQAFAKYRQSVENPIGLVLAGGKGWLFDKSWVYGVDGVYLTDYIDEEDKGTLYANAKALVFPTLYEGFGFPVIEAMLCGTPVITSTTSSLPELAGDAGILVNPESVDAIADAMALLMNDVDLYNQLVEKGYEQAKKFTWDIAAKQVMNVFEEIG